MSKWIAGLALLALTLSGCSVGPSSMTLQGAIEQSLNHPGPFNPVTKPDVRITKKIAGGVVALFTYKGDDNGKELNVTATYMFQRQGLGWFSTSGGAGARGLDEPVPPVEFGSGVYGMPNGNSYAVASGLISDPAVTQVAVTFGDGTREVMPVEREAYLAVKQDALGVTLIEGLGQDGQVLHRFEPLPPPVPGDAPPPPAPAPLLSPTPLPSR